MMITVDKNGLQEALRDASDKPEMGFIGPASCQVRTFWGGELQVMLPELVSTSIAFSRVYEKDLTFLFIEFLMPGMVLFDIGAHFGYFSLLGAHLVGPSGQVHSFEPTPSTCVVILPRTQTFISTTWPSTLSRRRFPSGISEWRSRRSILSISRV